MPSGGELRFLVGLRLERLVLSTTLFTSIVFMLVLIGFSALLGLIHSLERIGLVAARLILILGKIFLILHLVKNRYIAATQSVWAG